MATLSEMVVQVLSARMAKKEMSLEEMQLEINAIKKMIQGIETDPEAVLEVPVEDTKPTLTLKQAFKKDEVVCMICGKGFKTLKRHLALIHQVSGKEYKKQFNIPAKQTLAAKSYVESRRQMAIDKGLSGNLALAREKKAANVAEKKANPPAAKKTKSAAKSKK